MSNSILDADMGMLAHRLGEGWAWWVEQLKAMLPARLVRPRASGLIARAGPNGALRFTRGNRELAPMEAEGRAATIAVAEEQCLLRAMTMPALGEADVRRAVGLDLERLMPFPPHAALIETEVGPVTSAGREVVVAALPISTAEAALQAARRARVEPVALALLGLDDRVRFDFLPRLLALRSERALGAERRFWWRMVAGLFVLNLITLIVVDVRAMQALGDLVATHGQLAEQARDKRHRLLAEQAMRRSLADRRLRANPLALMADLSARLPSTAWLKRLELDHGHGRMVGIRDAATDVIGQLRRDPRLRNVHASSVDVIAATAAGQPFDISFDLAR